MPVKPLSELILTQLEFTRCVGDLIVEATSRGLLIQSGNLWRSDEQAAINALGDARRAQLAELLVRSGYETLARTIANNTGGNGILLSVHCDRLAYDIDGLYKKSGDVIVEATLDDYTSLGAWWKQLHPLARYGGDFRDPGHFSFEWQGRK